MASKCRLCDSELPPWSSMLLSVSCWLRGGARCGLSSAITLNYFHCTAFTSVEILETIQGCRPETKKQMQRVRVSFLGLEWGRNQHREHVLCWPEKILLWKTPVPWPGRVSRATLFLTFQTCKLYSYLFYEIMGFMKYLQDAMRTMKWDNTKYLTLCWAHRCSMWWLLLLPVILLLDGLCSSPNYEIANYLSSPCLWYNTQKCSIWSFILYY